MPNMRATKNPMPSQDPNVRNHNFDEVTLGYTAEMAVDEAQRCLHCKNMPGEHPDPRFHQKGRRRGF